jgi:hypothetical protein
LEKLEDVGVFTIGSDEDDCQDDEEKKEKLDPDTDDDCDQIVEDKPKAPPTKTEDDTHIDYNPVDRESSYACYHRLPTVGRKMLLDQFPAYFKIEQLIVPIARRKPTGFFAKWWKASESLSEPRLEPRFIAFEDGYILIMNYCPELPLRDFGVFNDAEGTQVKPLPDV